MNADPLHPPPLADTSTRRDYLAAALIVTLFCALAASWAHLADVFEHMYADTTLLGFTIPLGAVSATAIDGTLFVLALALGDIAGARVRLGHQAEAWARGRVYAGLLGLLAISALFNLDAAVTQLSGKRPMAGTLVLGVDALDMVRAVVGACTLPLLGAYLTHGLTELRVTRALVSTAARADTAASPARDSGPVRATLMDTSVSEFGVRFTPEALRKMAERSKARPVSVSVSQDKPGPKPKPAGQRPLTDRQLESVSTYLDGVARHGEDVGALADGLGVSTKTIRRWRKLAERGRHEGRVARMGSEVMA